MDLITIKEIVEKKRITCQFYLKVDFGMLAGIATVATILRLNRIEMFRYVSDVWLFPSGIIFAILYGLIFDRVLLSLWSKQRYTEKEKKLTLAWSSHGITIQLVLHLLLILTFFMFILGFSKGYATAHGSINSFLTIHSAIENFKHKNNKFPDTFLELNTQFPDISNELNSLGKDKVRYTLDKNRGFILRFADSDGRFNTNDDLVADHKSIYFVDSGYSIIKTQQANPSDAVEPLR